MSFESGGEMENPFDDPDDEDEPLEERDSRGDTEPESANERSSTTDSKTSSSMPPNDEAESTSHRGQPSDSTPAEAGDADYITDIDPGRSHSTERLARALMKSEYHSEAPPVPYATWRDGTSTGRGRTTLELNSDVDDLVRKAQAEFEDRYGTDITKADLREFAMVYGLAHLDDVFEMAEEWGIQYDN